MTQKAGHQHQASHASFALLVSQASITEAANSGVDAAESKRSRPPLTVQCSYKGSVNLRKILQGMTYIFESKIFAIQLKTFVNAPKTKMRLYEVMN